MSSLDQQRIGLVGLGAIGGSLALALRSRTQLVAWSRDPSDRAAAEGAGVPLCRGNSPDWVRDFADVTVAVIAVPLDEVAGVVRAVLPLVPNETLILHTASLQRRAALGLSEAEARRVLGTHPIAGSERSGFAAANAGMFRGATVRAESRATELERRRIEALWGAVGIDRLIWSDATVHDDLMSWVSHLPQLTATALAAVLGRRGLSPRDAGPGLCDVTRLAASDLAMWASILSKAPHETAAALRSLTSTLDALATAIETHDSTTVAGCWREARAWQRGIAEKPA
jgi:prephenate dehydrogenase